MRNLVRAAIFFCTALTLAACNGGGNGDGYTDEDDGMWSLSHEGLAEDFKDAMNDAGYNVSLAKVNTEIYNHIVIVDNTNGSYHAFNIGDYEPYDNINTFLDSAEFWNSAYHNLIPLEGNRYGDKLSGKIFSKVEGSPRDRMKLAAIEDQLKIRSMAEDLSSNYGLSVERSFEVAKLVSIHNKTDKTRMTDADHDRFAKAIMGHTFTEIKSAAMKSALGSGSELNALISDAAEFNGISPEDAHQILEKFN